MAKIKSWQMGIGLVSTILGFMLVVQLRTEGNINALLPTRQINELAKMYVTQKMQLEKYEQENNYLRKQLKNYDRDQEVVRLRMVTGSIPVRGKGILITLGDSDKKLNDYEDPIFYIVHYYQLELLMNELWNAGAEGIMINNNRIINSSGFSCAGTTILIDTKRIAPPFEIFAIGDPDSLRKNLTIPGGYVEREILVFNLKFLIETVEEIEIPAYKGSVSFDYAKPVEEEK